MEIQALVDDLARLIKRPITVENTDSRLIAYSAHEWPVDAVRMETLLRKGASKATIDVLRKHGVYMLIDSSPGVVKVKAIPEIGFTSRIAAAVRSGRGVVGYLWVDDDGVLLSAQDETAIMKTARLLSSKISKLEPVSEALENDADSLVMEILSPAGGKATLLEHRARLHGLQLYPPFQVMVLAGKASLLPQGLGVLRRHAEGFLLQEDVEAIAGIYEGDVVIVVAGESSPRVKQVAVGLARHVEAAGFPVSVGIGCSYRELSMVNRSLQEASEAINLAAGLNLLDQGPCFDYGQAALGDLVMCMPHCKARRTYGRDVVRKVALYDRLNGAELLKTLEAMLDCGGKRKDAAEYLHVHPNTVDYRLRKIEKVTGFPLDDPSMRLAVHLWIKALRYSGDQDEGQA